LNIKAVFREKRVAFWSILFLPALGYFVDMFDMMVFFSIRIESLKAIGVSSADIFTTGLSLANSQRWGLFLGGLIWGILGDKLGRQKVLLWSLLLFSLSTLLNAWVVTVEQYHVLRFISGFGLAAEFALALTLVTEYFGPQQRTLATGLIATLGILGGAAASGLVLFFPALGWRSSYLCGGGFGLLLLIARLAFQSHAEPVLYQETARQVKQSYRGQVSLLLFHPSSRQKFLCAMGLGFPVIYNSSVLIAFGPEIAASLGIVSSLDSGIAVTNAACLFASFLGSAVGDLTASALSYLIQSRRWAIFSGLLMFFFLQGMLFFLRGQSPLQFLFWCFAIGVSAGYWVVLITSICEQFGTDLRSTASGLTTNMLRSSGIILSYLFGVISVHWSQPVALMVMPIVLLVGVSFSWRGWSETFNSPIDFLEKPDPEG
jgi:MFS family permease